MSSKDRTREPQDGRSPSSRDEWADWLHSNVHRSTAEGLADEIVAAVTAARADCAAEVAAARADERAKARAEIADEGDLLTGYAIWLDREQWGYVIDGLILSVDAARKRFAVNSESTSDARAQDIANLIGHIGRLDPMVRRG